MPSKKTWTAAFRCACGSRRGACPAAARRTGAGSRSRSEWADGAGTWPASSCSLTARWTTARRGCLNPTSYGESVAPFWPRPEEYAAAVRFFAGRGIPTATHAIGDAGVAAVLDAFESLPPAGGRCTGGRAPDRTPRNRPGRPHREVLPGGPGGEHATDALHPLLPRRPDGQLVHPAGSGTREQRLAVRVTSARREPPWGSAPTGRSPRSNRCPSWRTRNYDGGPATRATSR